MEPELPSLGQLIALELAVVGLTVLATWRFAVYHFRRRQPSTAPPPVEEDRLAKLEEALDSVAHEVERLGEGQDFVQELLADRLKRLGLKHSPPRQSPEASEHPTPV
jgi:hypothetical protein